MARIQIASDLHLEQYRHAPPPGSDFLHDPRRDLLILAGDIGVGTGARAFIEEALSISPVVYVLGNHEHYVKQPHREVEAAWKEIENKRFDLYVLNAEPVEVADLRIWGGAGYSDLWGNPNPILGNVLINTITDFSPGINDQGEWTVDAHVEESRRHQRAMREHAGAVDVVVTHWPPTTQAIDPRYAERARDRLVNPYFVNDWPALIDEMGAKLWISGHTHTPHDVMESATRCLGNPRGYRTERKDPRYDPCLSVEIS